MILIVDDDAQSASSLERFFRYVRLEAVAINSGMEALFFLNTSKPRLIIIDLKMPVMDGLTLIRAIRSDKNFKAVPILVYTSDVSKRAETDSLKAGAQGFLIKGTVSMTVVLSKVREMMGPEEIQGDFTAP